MADERQCNECGGKLPADAPQGLCPQCLMKLGLPSEAGGEDHALSDEQAAIPTSATPPGGFVPLEPEELAKKFPQLEILELLGQGGMGAVYKARQKQLERLVALKILPPEVGRAPAFAERFSREARSLARLNHPGIVSVFDFGRTEDGLYYFIMEFVDGTDLRRVIEGGQLDPVGALAIVPQICEALQYAHEEGLVHRDIKPENILLDKKGRVKIADFGLAKLLGKPATAYTLTQAGQRMGTPHYMAPEQIEGAHEVDHRADIYSLGVVFYEMLTGELPIGRFVPPSKKVQVDVRLDEIVLHTLEKEPELRYQQASEIKTDVETIAGGNKPLTHAAAHPGSPAIYQQIKRPAIGLLIVCVVGLLTWPARELFMSWMMNRTFLSTSPIWTLVDFLEYTRVPELAKGLFLIAAGLPMLWMRGYRLAVAASIVAMLPAGPSFLVGLPIGIWALAILTKPEVKAAFPRKERRGKSDGSNEAGEMAAGRQLVAGPAKAMLVAGIINLIAAPATVLFWIMIMELQLVEVDGIIYRSSKTVMGVLMIAQAVALPIASVTIAAALSMKRLRTYGLAVTGGFMLLLPLNLGWLVGLPIGIWVLAVLSKQEVKAAFPHKELKDAGVAQRRFSRAAIVGACCVPLAIFLLVPALALTGPKPLCSSEFFTMMRETTGGFVLVILCALVGLTASFVTTILGIVSIAQIRQSAGRLYGMGLALFDALLFPVLALNIGIVAVLVLAGMGISEVVILTLIIGGLLDFFLIRRAWRKANAGLEPEQRHAPPNED